MGKRVESDSTLERKQLTKFKQRLTYRTLNKMKTITYSQLLAKLATINGLAIIGLHALTDTKARKTGNPFGQVFKQVSTVGFVGANYEDAVNREAIRQDGYAEFQAEKLPWGQWLIRNKVIEHNGKLYLRTQTTPGNRRKQPAKVTAYRTANGQFVSREDIKPFLPVARESNKQQKETGIDQTVWVRTYAFDSIQRIRIAGQTYSLTH